MPPGQDRSRKTHANNKQCCALASSVPAPIQSHHGFAFAGNHS